VWSFGVGGIVDVAVDFGGVGGVVVAATVAATAVVAANASNVAVTDGSCCFV